MTDQRPPGPGDDDYAPGWDALDDVFGSAFPGQEPHHWKPSDVLLPGQDGVWGISGYRDGDDWFYVTYGLSDLFDLFAPPDPETVEPDAIKWSGFGLELTMRVPADEGTPPLWPVELLDKLAKYTYRMNIRLGSGHRLDPGGPITGGRPPTRLTAVAFAQDPVFKPIDTTLGRVDFVTVVGITHEELARARATTTNDILVELETTSPRLVTDPAR